jgi:hypothetical protein
METMDVSDKALLNTLIELNRTRDINKIYEIIDGYLQENIEGIGCSIFEVDNTTNRLNLVYSKFTKDSEKDKPYEKGEGFTGWVFKYRKFLYIENEENYDEIKKISPEPPKHVGKYKETEKIGPFMAAPILSKGTLLLTLDDFKDIDSFIIKLIKPTNSLSTSLKKHLNHLLSKGYPELNSISEKLALIDGINQIMQTSSLYSPEMLVELKLSRDTINLANNPQRDKDDILLLNRSLLEEVYRNEIAKCHVIGVIRVPAVKGDKEKFTKKEQDRLKIFAIKISECIENANNDNKTKNLISIYEKLGDLNKDTSEFDSKPIETPDPDLSISKLLGKFIKEVPNIVGGGNSSIFLLKEDNKLVPIATTSESTQFLSCILEGFHYEKGGGGLTYWIFDKKISIKIDDLTDDREIKKLDPDLVILRVPHEIAPADVGPFLAVPMIVEDRSIGVIRVIRHKDSTPFAKIDEKLLLIFANILSLAISNLNRKKEIENSRNKIKNSYVDKFSLELINKVSEIECISYRDEIKQFFDKDELIEDISEHILTTLENLWAKKYKIDYNFPLFEHFRTYENMLFELPKYRDHFIHQFQVFLLGAIIIDKMYIQSKKDSRIKNFSDYYAESLNSNTNGSDADLAWLITSTFHDVAYPIEKSDQIFNKFFDKFMGIGEIAGKSRIEEIFCECNYLRLIDNLCQLFACIEFTNKKFEYNGKSMRTVDIDDIFSQSLRFNLIKNRDHGVLGALILLHQSNAGAKEFLTVIYPSALAIALHNKLLPSLHKDIYFDTNPLAFLLRYCDLIQEWGRKEENSQKNPQLLSINIYLDDNDKKVHVSTEISMGNGKYASEKSLEAKTVFNRLRSKNIIFELFIFENGIRLKSS